MLVGPERLSTKATHPLSGPSPKLLPRRNNENSLSLAGGVALSVLLVLLLLAATPSFADTLLYTNGPINGTIGGYFLNDGYSLATSFKLSSASNISSFSVGLWDAIYPPIGVTWWITTTPDFNLGDALASGTGGFNNSAFLGMNEYSYQVYASTMTGLNVSLGAGTYYLGLKEGWYAPYWDINYGPSTAYVNFDDGITNVTTLGIASPAFTIYGTSATPEPGTMLMFGTGALGLMGAIRRRFSL